MADQYQRTRRDMTVEVPAPHVERGGSAPVATGAPERNLRLSEALWSKLEPILLKYDPPPRVGRRRTGQRRAMEAVLYRIATNCAWHELPPEFPHPSSVYRSYRRWLRTGALGEVLITIQEHMARRRSAT